MYFNLSIVLDEGQVLLIPVWASHRTKKGRGIDQNGAENVEITVRKMKIMDSVALLVSTF